MAKQQPQRPQQAPQPPKKAAPAPARRAEKKDSFFNRPGNRELIFDKQNFIYMGAGLLLVLLGLAAMSGGAMPDPNKWEPERIYSFRRITLAPIMMIAGFVVVILGIFKKKATTDVTDNAELYQ
ncbi:MAG: DUF3098 domain-containing protein [Saprospiraceae bacterium]|nr:DUF3098 domain-containing protein [Saprospiraceae bacterium]